MELTTKHKQAHNADGHNESNDWVVHLFGLYVDQVFLKQTAFTNLIYCLRVNTFWTCACVLVFSVGKIAPVARVMDKHQFNAVHSDCFLFVAHLEHPCVSDQTGNEHRCVQREHEFAVGSHLFGPVVNSGINSAKPEKEAKTNASSDIQNDGWRHNQQLPQIASGFFHLSGLRLALWGFGAGALTAVLAVQTKQGLAKRVSRVAGFPGFQFANRGLPTAALTGNFGLS